MIFHNKNGIKVWLGLFLKAALGDLQEWFATHWIQKIPQNHTEQEAERPRHCLGH